jgi:hypothetical protein
MASGQMKLQRVSHAENKASMRWQNPQTEHSPGNGQLLWEDRRLLLLLFPQLKYQQFLALPLESAPEISEAWIVLWNS